MTIVDGAGFPARRHDTVSRACGRCAAFVVLTLSISLTAAAPVNKCVDPGGRVSYQDAPCDAAAAGKTIAVQPARMESGDTQLDERNAVVRLLQTLPLERINVIVETLGLFDRCAKLVPGFGTLHGARMAEWKRRNSSAIELIEQEPVMRARIQKRGEASAAATSNEERDTHRITCEAYATRYLGAKPDTAGFDTPPTTWQRMISALKSGDIDAAMEAFTPGARPKYRALYSALNSADRGRSVVATMSQLDGLTVLTSDSAMGSFKLPGGYGGQVFFIRVNERWYISRAD